VHGCDAEMQRELLANVVLAGGNACFPGMAERLTAELRAMFPDHRDAVRVVQPEHAEHLCWSGGSLAASALLEEDLPWLTWAEYDECGAHHMRARALGVPYFNEEHMRGCAASGVWEREHRAAPTPPPPSPLVRMPSELGAATPPLLPSAHCMEDNCGCNRFVPHAFKKRQCASCFHDHDANRSASARKMLGIAGASRCRCGCALSR
jgi:hypothetical protein